MSKAKSTIEKEIKKSVKVRVWERDKKRCVLCLESVGWWNANAHVVSRAYGGLGIEQNIVTLCNDCHRQVDQSIARERLIRALKKYLEREYPGYDFKNVVYRKWEE